MAACIIHSAQDKIPIKPGYKWRTINHAKVLLNGSDKVIAGAGGKFKGKKWGAKWKLKKAAAAATISKPTVAPKPAGIKAAAAAAISKPTVAAKHAGLKAAAATPKPVATPKPAAGLKAAAAAISKQDLTSKAVGGNIEAIRSKFPSLKNYATIAKQKKENLQKRFPSITPQIEKEYATEMKRILDNSAFGMKIQPSKFKLVMDSWFKNQIETGTSGGALNIRLRRELSNCISGTPFDAEPKDFEKYGLAVPKDVNMESLGGDWYGDCIVRFKKDNLKGRVTYTTDDSLNMDFDSQCFGDVEAPSFCAGETKVFRCADPTYAQDHIKKLKSCKDGANDFTKTFKSFYLELQYHGDLTPDDIESVVIPSEEIEYMKSAIQKCKKRGIKIYKSKGGKVYEL